MKLQRAAVALATVTAGCSLMMGTAHAVDCYPQCGEVKGDTQVQAPPVVTPAAVVQTSSSGPVLALTGADVTEISIIGLGLLGVGTVMVRRSRKATQKA